MDGQADHECYVHLCLEMHVLRECPCVDTVKVRTFRFVICEQDAAWATVLERRAVKEGAGG